MMPRAQIDQLPVEHIAFEVATHNHNAATRLERRLNRASRMRREINANRIEECQYIIFFFFINEQLKRAGISVRCQKKYM